MHVLRRIWDRGLKGALLTAVFVGALASVPSVQARKDASSATFRVTLNAQLTKTWDYVTTREEGNCTVTERVRGSRTVTLATARPTIIKATTSGSRLRFNPSAMRFVTARTRQGGSVVATERGAGCGPAIQSDCPRTRRTLANQTLRFFRSGRNELSFRRARDFGTSPATCPPEDPEVREERVGLDQAEGELAERDLYNLRIRTLFAGGSSTETIDMEGDPTGRVVLRVSWRLTFNRS